MRLYGKNSTIERLRANPQTVKKIFLEDGADQSGVIRAKAKKHDISVSVVPFGRMQKMSQGKNTQGVICDIDDFGYLDYDDLLTTATDKKIPIFFLDRLTDPQNFGAMIRSFACLGRFGIVIPTHETVSVTETVLRVASGGDNYVAISVVPNLNAAIRAARDAGFTIAGAILGEGEPLTDISFPALVGVVIGSEESGIRDGILKNIDVRLMIPMAHDTLSLNAAHAATIIAYEIIRQKISRKKIAQSGAQSTQSGPDAGR
jgi:23S rRNA (guanosine2251-2'-O)-methyltransferase